MGYGGVDQNRVGEVASSGIICRGESVGGQITFSA